MNNFTEFFNFEFVIRGGFFIGSLLLLTFLERLFPLRKKYGYQKRRWVSNIAIVWINSLLVRLIFPLLAVDIAILSHQRGWGLFQHIQLNNLVTFLLGILILDLAIYLQHIMFHYVPLFWRFHRMHHADLDFDVSTGVRFHPGEIFLSMLIKMGVVAAFGLSYLSVLVFEVILNASSMFTHTNVSIPKKLEGMVRAIFVTPDMHRIHHSIYIEETNSNFGFNLSIWDRLFGTYLKKPKDDQKDMTIGIDIFRHPKFLKLGWLMVIPFLRGKRD